MCCLKNSYHNCAVINCTVILSVVCRVFAANGVEGSVVASCHLRHELSPDTTNQRAAHPFAGVKPLPAFARPHLPHPTRVIFLQTLQVNSGQFAKLRTIGAFPMNDAQGAKYSGHPERSLAGFLAKRGTCISGLRLEIRTSV